MDLPVFLHDVLRPGLVSLAAYSNLPPDRAAERFLLAIALQESDAAHRYQHSPAHTPGPARGFWQFETAGVLGVLTHRSTAQLAEEACRRAHVVHHTASVHRAIEGHDGLAVALARLLVLTDPRPMPQTETQGWDKYIALWRPGRPRLERWAGCWQRADQATLPPRRPDGDVATDTGV